MFLNRMNGFVGLGGGQGNRRPPYGTPSLVMDFAPSADDVDWVALDLNFAGDSYRSSDPDPSLAAGDRVNLLVWR